MQQKSSLTILWSILFAGIALRALLLAHPAFVDTTDARYAAIGLEMVTTGNWVTPYVNQGAAIMPYWSKPPLGFWMTAGSYQIFGVSEWVARLPSFLSTLLMVFLTMLLAERWWGRKEALLSGIVLLSSILVFFMAGACTMDAALGACVTGAFVLFALATQQEGLGSAWWGRGFFVALGLGVLAKGPIAIIFVGVGLFFWVLKTGRWSAIRSLPWISGPLLFLIVAAPWYYLAEQATPGFLEYFLGNENFSRLVSKDLAIKYGRGHKSPLGAVWPMLGLAFFPWILTFLLPLISSHKRKALKVNATAEFIYAVTWGLGAVVFLSFGKQVVATYLVPMLPGLALAVAYLIGNAEKLLLDNAVRILSRGVAVLLVVCAIGVIIRYASVEMAGINWFFATCFFVLMALSCRKVFQSAFDSISSAAWTGASLFMLFGLVVSLIHTEVSSIRSTRPVFEYLISTSQGKSSVIAFLNEIPDSAQVYRKLWFEKGLKVVGLPPNKVDSGEIDFLVGRAGDLEKLALTTPRISVFESRKWRVLKLSDGNKK